MDGIETRNSEEASLRYWARQAIYVLLAAMASLAFVLAFAVEFVGVIPGAHKSAHRLLRLSQGTSSDLLRHAQPTRRPSAT